MRTPEIEELLQEPDAVLFDERHGQPLQEYIGAFTVPLCFFHGRVEPDRYAGCGSGVLVKLRDGCGFLLTAGHCVKGEIDAGACSVGIATQPHRFVPTFGRRLWRYKHGDSRDIGVFEIPPSEYGKFKAYGKTFMKPSRIEVHDASHLRATNDWFVVGGFPGSVALNTEVGRGSRLVNYSMTIAGLGSSPASALGPMSPGLEAIDLWRAHRGQVQTFPSTVGEVAPPDLGGASGGGCWRTNARPDPTLFDVEASRLVGLHIGTLDISAPEPYGTLYFSREVLVGHHLRLIADEIAALRDLVFSQWPQLEDERWVIA